METVWMAVGVVVGAVEPEAREYQRCAYDAAGQREGHDPGAWRAAAGAVGGRRAPAEILAAAVGGGDGGGGTAVGHHFFFWLE